MLTYYVLATYPIRKDEERQRPSSIIGTIHAPSLLDAIWDVRDLIQKPAASDPIEKVLGLDIHLKNGVILSVGTLPVDPLSVWLARAVAHSD